METRANRKLHPLLAAAAVSVIVLAIVGIGAFTGLLPGTIGSPKADDAAAANTPAEHQAPHAEAPAAVSKPAARHVARAVPARSHARPSAPKPAQVASARPACTDCGVVEAVREVEVKGQGTGLGAVAGGVLGGVLGHQVGNGRGKDVATVLGAVGGALAGNQVEKKARAATHWEVTVKLDNGATRIVSTESLPPWRAGDRVRVVDDALQAVDKG